MKLIQTVTVGSGGASSIEFGAGGTIPQTYTDLVILISARSNRTNAPIDTIRARFNGVTTGYTYRAVEGTGSGTPSSFTSTSFNAGIAATDNCTAGIFGNAQLYIPNYTSSLTKSGSAEGLSENNSASANQFMTASLSTATAAITSIVIAPETGTLFNQYSTASLYGVTKGSSGGVVVS